jgi:hypothetical protein
MHTHSELNGPKNASGGMSGNASCLATLDRCSDWKKIRFQVPLIEVRNCPAVQSTTSTLFEVSSGGSSSSMLMLLGP